MKLGRALDLGLGIALIATGVLQASLSTAQDGFTIVADLGAGFLMVLFGVFIIGERVFTNHLNAWAEKRRKERGA
jgi:hypothetical protein